MDKQVFVGSADLSPFVEMGSLELTQDTYGVWTLRLTISVVPS